MLAVQRYHWCVDCVGYLQSLDWPSRPEPSESVLLLLERRLWDLTNRANSVQKLIMKFLLLKG